MQACLPRKASDELGAELMVAAYQKKLGHFSQCEITAMTDAALEGQWFPTIAECLKLIDEWVRNDEHTASRRKANELIAAEKQARLKQPVDLPAPDLTQETVDALPELVASLGVQIGSLKIENGKAVVA